MTGKNDPDAVLQVRDSGPGEAPVLLDLIRRAFAEHRGRLMPPSSAEHKTAEIVCRELATAQALICEARTPGGRGVTPAGCVFFRPQDDGVYLDRLSVLPDWRGRGIARALMAEVERRARARNACFLALSVRLTLTRQQRLYRALGFAFHAYGIHEGFREPTFVKMRKPLA